LLDQVPKRCAKGQLVNSWSIHIVVKRKDHRAGTIRGAEVPILFGAV
jgi:hypothetical protein